MSGVARKYASVWRRSGLNYIQAMTAASNALRNVLREPKRSQALARASFTYRMQAYEEGKVIETSALLAHARMWWAVW